MTSTGDDKVILDRVHFDALLRRANFKDAFDENHGTSNGLMITVPKPEYEELSKVARQYANLRQSLLNGGVDEQKIALLSSDESAWGSSQKAAQSTVNGAAASAAVGASATVGHANADQHEHRTSNQTFAIRPPEAPSAQQYTAKHHHHHQNEGPGGGDGVGDGSSEFEALGDVGTGLNDNMHDRPQRPQFERMATRTVQLCNLPDGTTHADITAVVRGGQLLDVYLRTHDRSAQVSFLNSSDAKNFYDHVRRHDLYIRQKRVEVRWADRQFVLPGHAANKIGLGATRNLVVRRCDGRHTEESVRDDLEHIHNLIVIRVNFVGSSCFISTNSVNNALFARTCMMSRLKYRGSKIEWDADECAQPLEQPRKLIPQPQGSIAKPTLNPTANRFQLLNVDDNESDDDNQESILPNFANPRPFRVTA